MRAVTVIPGQPGSIALSDMPEPPSGDGPVLVETLAVGICGTDLEIINGEYGSAPPGAERLVIGHVAGLITRQVPLAQWADGYTRQPGDIKTILTF